VTGFGLWIDHAILNSLIFASGFAGIGTYIIACLGFSAYALSFLVPPSRVLTPLLVGLLLGPALEFAGIGTLLLPLTLIALLIGIGILGFLPFVTCWAFWSRAKFLACQAGLSEELKGYAAVVAGLVICIAVGAWGIENAWLDARYDALSSSDVQRNIAAIHELNDYPLCHGVCQKRVCESPAATRQDPAVQAAIMRLTGIDNEDDPCGWR